MIADITRAENGYIARFERHLKHPVEQVWSWLTENDKLSQWFSELRVSDLREGGVITFNMPDGTFKELEILDFAIHSVLAFTWGEDRVRFELTSESEGCHLVLIETIANVTDHTPKDLAGWHVCLDVIQALMDGRTLASRYPQWQAWYEEYAQLMETLPKSEW
ncbi:MAG: SRPBCC family protein [Clostridia bacterium]